jgi:hypothetical protein
MYKFISIVGANQSGKTYHIRKKLIKYSKNEKILVINCNSEPDYKEFQKIENIQDIKTADNGVYYYNIPDELFSMTPAKLSNFIMQECLQLSDLLLIIDDARILFSHNITMNSKRLAISYAQKRMNLVMSFHSLNDIPVQLMPHINEVHLFRTSTICDIKNNKTFDFLKKVEKKVNKKNKVGYYNIIKLF